MTLNKQTASFAFGNGVDTKSDPKTVQGALLKLQNAFYQTPRMVRKRYGSQALANTPAAAAGIASYKNTAVIFDGKSVYPQMTSQGYSVGNYEPMNVTESSVYHGQLGIYNVDMAYQPTSGIQAYIWTGGNGFVTVFPYYALYDSKTGQAIVAGNTLPWTTNPPTNFKVLPLGTTKFVFLYIDGTGNLRYSYVDTGSPLTLNGPTNLATDVNATNQYWDATVINGKIYVAYNTTHAGGGITLLSMDSSFSVTTKQVNGDAASGGVTISGDGSNNAWVAYYNGTSVKGFAYNGALTTVVQALTTVDTRANIQAMTLVASSGTATVVYSTNSAAHTVSAGAFSSTTAIYRAAFGSSPSSATLLNRSLSLVGKVYQQGTSLYCLTAYINTSTQPTYFLLDVTLNVCIAKFSAGIAGWAIDTQGCLQEAPSPAANTWYFPVIQLDQAVSATDFSGRNGIDLMTVVYGGPVSAVEIGNALHLSGGFVSMFDGLETVEHGFHLFPEPLTLGITATSGNLSTGSYGYIAVYEWIDGQGQLHQSAPSPPTTVALSGSSGYQVSITVSTLRVSQKTTVNIALYRTAVNGTIYYRLNQITNPFANDPTVDTVQFFDNTADTGIIGHPQLYTTGGEVNNYPAPATSAMCTYRDRLVVIPADSPNSYWYSKQVIPSAGQAPGTPVELSAFFVQNVDPKGGGLTAGCQMDDKLILFKASTAGYVVGSGPAPTGVGNDLTDWQQIAGCDAGTGNPASVVLMPDGIMFQAAKGICLLDRALGMSYIGGPVEALVQGQTVTSAVLVSLYNQVRFTLTGGIRVVYDYLTKQWMSDTDVSAVGACIYQGAYTHVQANGTALQESSSAFTDNGTFYPLLIQTSWLKFDVFQGYQRVYECEIIGDWKSAHTLQIGIAYDFNPAIVQTVQIVANSSQVPYQNRFRFNIQKCQAVQLTIQDVQSGSFGEGLNLSGLAFVVGVKGGRLTKVPAVNSY